MKGVGSTRSVVTKATVAERLVRNTTAASDSESVLPTFQPQNLLH